MDQKQFFILIFSILLFMGNAYGAQSLAQSKISVDSVPITIESPKDGQEIFEPVIKVHGKTIPSATVTAGGLELIVSDHGEISGSVPIADEPGELNLEIVASSQNKQAKVSLKLNYVPAIKLTVSTPIQGAVTGSREVVVSGRVEPFLAAVLIDGKVVTVRSDGTFSQPISLPEKQGDHELVIIASINKASRSVRRTITFRTATDTEAPSIYPVAFPANSTQAELVFTVNDRTPDDQILWHHSIDGREEIEKGKPGGRFALPLCDGVHNYLVFAVDRSGNTSARLEGTIARLSVMPTIKISSPSGGTAEVSATEESIAIEGSIGNVPDDDPRLIKNIIITNKATKRVVSLKNLRSLDFSADVDLQQNIVNTIVVEVKDINDRVVRQQVEISFKKL